MSRVLRGMRVVRVGAIALSVAVAGCDPCAGVASCSSSPRLAVSGNIVEQFSGQPQKGVRIDVIRAGGVALDADSTTVFTDADGRWQVDVGAQAAGSVHVDINVRYGVTNYRARDVELTADGRRGAAQVLPTWVSDPHFSYAAELHYRTLDDIRVQGATVEFHRTGGIGFFAGDGGSVFTGISDAAGRVSLFDVFAHSPNLGDVIGDLVVHLPGDLAPDTTRGISLSATQLLNSPPPTVIRIGVGPSLLYEGEFHERRTGKPAPGVIVTFQRTGGATTDPQTFTATTRDDGRFTFPLRALSEGTVIGDLHVTPPPPGTPFTIVGVKLPPFRDDVSRLLAVWGEGPSLPWAGLLLAAGRPAPGVVVDFHRIGGIQVQPADYTTLSDGAGNVALNPQPQDTGFVDANVTVHSPAPFAPFTTRLRLHTVQDDTTGGVTVTWKLESPPSASRIESKRTAAGARVIRP